MGDTQFEARPQARSIDMVSDYEVYDAGLNTAQSTSHLSAPANSNGEHLDLGRFRSASVCGIDGEAARLSELRSWNQKTQILDNSTEDRLNRLEKEYLKLLSASMLVYIVWEANNMYLQRLYLALSRPATLNMSKENGQTKNTRASILTPRSRESVLMTGEISKEDDSQYPSAQY